MSNLTFMLSSLVVTAIITLILMPYGIRLFVRLGLGKNIRAEGLIGQATEFATLHASKKGTPTMGGAIIISIILIIAIISVFIQYSGNSLSEIIGVSFRYSLWNRRETYLVIFTLVSVGIIGMVDDYMNIRGIGRTKWLPAKVKMILLIIFALAGAYWFSIKLGYTGVHLPFYGQVELGYFYIPLFVLIVVATANSVNITDGLDGLAWGLLLFEFLAYGAITYLQGMFILSAFCLIVVGVLMWFLWFNIHPASIFMGDTWSLALGATLAVIAMMTDTLLAFVVMSAIFILETLSVIVQMTSKRLRGGKKIFRIAPYHHHLEAIGWEEETIVMRLWLVGMICTIAGTILALIGRI
jgi:phospho-N-acetylmuramoyl-pentapeptide-transferase